MRGEQRAFGIDGKLLPVVFAFSYGIHKVVVNEQAAIDTRYRSHSCPGIYKSLCVGMLYTQGECDRAADHKACCFLPRMRVALQRTDNVRCRLFRLLRLKLRGINSR